MTKLGQTDFITSDSGKTKSKLDNPKELAFDKNKNELFVADKDNNRIMVFDIYLISNGEGAFRIFAPREYTTMGQEIFERIIYL